MSSLSIDLFIGVRMNRSETAAKAECLWTAIYKKDTNI
jgi:hypothetical protein